MIEGHHAGAEEHRATGEELADAQDRGRQPAGSAARARRRTSAPEESPADSKIRKPGQAAHATLYEPPSTFTLADPVTVETVYTTALTVARSLGAWHGNPGVNWQDFALAMLAAFRDRCTERGEPEGRDRVARGRQRIALRHHEALTRDHISDRREAPPRQCRRAIVGVLHSVTWGAAT